MKKHIILLFLLSSGTLLPQGELATMTGGKIFNLNIGCNYDNSVSVKKETLIYPASERSSYIVQKILSFSGLNPNFEIYEAKINNAVATIVDDRRLILYDNELLKITDYASDSYWTSISILAHEIGHHLSGHTLTKRGSNHKDELEADKFSGFVLYKMGASLNEAKKAISFLGTAIDTESHPNKQRRLNAIATGWYDANSQKYKSAIPPPPENDYHDFYINEFNYDEITSDVFIEFYEEDASNWNLSYMEGIIIDIEDLDATDFAHYTGDPYNNIALNIHITYCSDSEPTYNGKKVGDRDVYHMVNYHNSDNATIRNLNGILVPGRKIGFKSCYFGYGYEDIFYIKRLKRSENIPVKSELNGRIDINAKNIITSFLVAEENRSIFKILNFYSTSPKKYYTLNYPSKEDIKKQYYLAWNKTSTSINNIKSINKISEKIYDLETEFVFIDRKGNRKSVNSVVRFVFDNNLKIIETYNY